MWALTVDVESWPDTTPTVTFVQRLDDGPLVPGSTARVHQPGQRAKVWTVITVEPEHCFAWRARSFGTLVTATHTLDATPTGTSHTLSIEMEGTASGLIGRLLHRPILAALATENAGLARAAES